MSSIFSGGAGSPPSSGETSAQVMQAYEANLPQLAAEANATDLGTAVSQLNAAQNTTPGWNALNLQQAQQYQLPTALVGANTNLGLLQGAGGQSAAAAVGLNNALNPVQAADNTQAQNLVNSIQLNGLSGGEQAAVERGINSNALATGNVNNPNMTNTINNALNFGGAFNQKVGVLGNALGSANNVAQAQNSQVNPVNTALATGQGTQFVNSQAPAAATNTAGTFSNNALSGLMNIGNTQQGLQATSNYKNSMQGTASTNAAMCFLTTACCTYKGLPDNCEELETLRDFRDNYVPKHMVAEYYHVAPAIVDRIKDNPEELEFVYGIVKQCVEAIRLGHNALALGMYEGMVNHLKGETV